jgi:hypothetical protein
MQNKMLFGLDFAANIVLAAWFCCNMSGSSLDMFRGATDARTRIAFLSAVLHSQDDEYN